MLVGFNSNGIGLSAKIVEPNINREASNYIINNYGNLLGIIRHCDISIEKANDLLHDVYISIVDAEDNGNGFDTEYGSRVNEDGDVDYNLMSVEQFVIGRIKLYAKNTKYRSDIIEAYNGHVNEVNVYYVAEIDEYGQEIMGKDGKPKLTKKVETNKVSVLMTVNAASFNDGGDVTENNDDLQKAYATASIADSTDDVTDTMSLREQIDYCIDICEMNGFNILNVLKNIDALSEMIGDVSKKKKTSESIFKQLTDLVELHDEFGAVLMHVLQYSARNRSAFEAVLATY